MLGPEAYPGQKNAEGQNMPLAEVNTIKLNQRMTQEVFVDAYAKQNAYKNGILESFEKYRLLSGNRVGFLNDRVNALNNDEIYIGTSKSPTILGF